MNSNNASESNAVEVTNKKNKVNGPKCCLRYKKNQKNKRRQIMRSKQERVLIMHPSIY